MKTKKYTKGPWELHCYRSRGTVDKEGEIPWDYASQSISTQDGVMICEASMNTSTKGFPEVADYEEMMANARLIAETPTILEMLIEAVEHIDKNEDRTNPFTGRLEALLNRISGEETK